MDLTAFASWLNATFAGFDAALSDFAYWLHAGALGEFFDWFFPTITVLGNGGMGFIVLGVILLLFRRSRKAGATILIALLLGLLITNLCVKPLVARPRPYADELSVFFTRWQEIGHGLENEVDSFPSGHATAAFGAMFALFWCGNKKYSWAAFIPALLIGFSRVYIYVHYASDIVGGAVAGLVTGTVAFLLIGLLWKRLTTSENKAAKFVTTASIVNLFRRKTQ